MHVAKFGFRGLRKLNHNFELSSPSFSMGGIELWDAGDVNIVVGENGSGKSTIVDMIAAISDANKLGTVARENTKAVTASGFKVVFKDGSDFVVKFSQNDKKSINADLCHIDKKGLVKRVIDTLDKSGNSSADSNVADFLKALDINANHRSIHNEANVDEKVFISKLNAISSRLVGLAPYPLTPEQTLEKKYYDRPPGSAVSPYVLANPIMLKSEGRVHIWVNDDQLQSNEIPISLLPSGWRAYGGLTAWLEEVDEGTICVIEEPETHIHPTLMRILIKEICEISHRRKLQLFMATHSPIFINSTNWGKGTVKIFQAKGHYFREMTNVASALRDIGARPSDHFMSNGIIWIEGASDRLYINHWLKLWCEKTGATLPKENVEYSFSFYGGAMLSHFCASASDGKIDIFKQNPNAIILMDRDFDFVKGTDGEEIARNPYLPKSVIYEQMRSMRSATLFPWITHGYTIENYLPYKFRSRYFQVKRGRLLAKNGGNKVRIFEQYARHHNNFDNCFEATTDLQKQISKLHDVITKWNA